MRRTTKRSTGIGALAAAVAFLIFAVPALAQDIGHPDPEVIEGLYPGNAYSPYAQRSFPSRVYWGETHLHTGVSLDAGLFGAILGHEEAYRLARPSRRTNIDESRCCGTSTGGYPDSIGTRART